MVFILTKRENIKLHPTTCWKQVTLHSKLLQVFGFTHLDSYMIYKTITSLSYFHYIAYSKYVKTTLELGKNLNINEDVKFLLTLDVPSHHHPKKMANVFVNIASKLKFFDFFYFFYFSGKTY